MLACDLITHITDPETKRRLGILHIHYNQLEEKCNVFLIEKNIGWLTGVNTLSGPYPSYRKGIGNEVAEVTSFVTRN